MSSDESRDPVEALAEEFLARHRNGERPSVAEYCRQHPHLAGRIDGLFPTLLLMEEMGEEDSPPPPPPDIDTPPPPLSEYHVLRTIGRGGMGVVYEAVHESLGRHVAVKVLPQSHLQNDIQLERFRREARAAAKLHHTNIVPVFDVGQQDGVHYYAMQFITGQSLDKVLANIASQDEVASPDAETKGDAADASSEVDDAEPLPSSVEPVAGRQAVKEASVTPQPPFPETPKTGSSASHSLASFELLDGDLAASASRPQTYYRNIAKVGLQVAQALAYVHQHELLHRDIKPSNLLLDEDGRVWVTDFGLAKAEESEDLTHTGGIVGTLRYMAPERFQGQSTALSDVYGLGATLYELLTRKPVFADSDRIQLVQRIAVDEPLPPRKIDPTIPRDLQTIILKAINKDPHRRYENCGELAEDLRRWLKFEPITAHAITLPKRVVRWSQRRPLVASLLATVVLLTVVGFSLVTWKWSEADAALKESNKNYLAAEAARGQAAQQEAEAKRQKADALLNLDKAQRVVFDFLTNVALSPELLGGTQGAQLLRIQLLEKAEKYYESFLAQGNPLASERAFVVTRFRLARLRSLTGKLASAESGFQKVIGQLQSLLAQNPNDHELQHYLAHCHEGLGTVLQETGRLSQAFDRFQVALTEFDELLSTAPRSREYLDDVAIVLNHLGEIERRRGRYTSAARFAGRGISLREQLGDRPASGQRHALATNYVLLARVLNEERKFQEARELLDKAIAQRQLIYQEYPTSPWNRNGMTTAHLLLAMIEKGLGENEAAAKRLANALKTQAALCRDNPSVPKYRSLLGVVHLELGKIALNAGQTRQAVSMSQKATDHFTELRQLKPESQIDQDRLCQAASQLGQTLQRAGKTAEAIQQHERALKILEQRCQAQPDIPGYRRQLSETLMFLANILQTQGKWKEARRLYDRAAVLLENLSRDFSRISVHRYGLTSCYNNLGVNSQSQKRVAEATTWFEKAGKTGRALVADHPSVPKYLESAAMSFNNLGVSYRNQGRLKDAIRLFVEGVDLRRKAVAARPQSLKYRIGLAEIRVNLGMAWRLKKEWSKAIGALDEAEKGFQDVLTKSPRQATARQYLKVCRLVLIDTLSSRAIQETNKIATGGGDYKQAHADATRACELSSWKSPSALAALATSESRLGNHQLAVKHSQAAVDAAPPQLKPLFQKRLAAYQAKAAEKKKDDSKK